MRRTSYVIAGFVAASAWSAVSSYLRPDATQRRSLAVIGTAAGVWRVRPAGHPVNATKEAVTMSTRVNRRAPATTFLAHFFGRGPVDEGRA